MTEEKVMKKLGQPTKYREEYCEKVIEVMMGGASKGEVCLELECTYQTFLNWQEKFPEFKTAVAKGLNFSKGKWEQMGRRAAFGQVENFNATAYIFNMKNRFGKIDEFGEKWSDKQEHEHSGQVTTFNMDFGKKPDADD